MRGQAGHELLAHHARGPQDTDINRSHEPTPFADPFQKQKTRLGLCRGGWLVARGEGRSMAGAYTRGNQRRTDPDAEQARFRADRFRI